MQFQFTSLRPWIFCAIALRFFSDGAEETFIAPTAWNYIKSLGETITFLGLVLIAFQVGALLTGSIVGRLADRFGNIKRIIIISFAMKSAAYLIYLIPVSAYFPLAGRLLSGLADGSSGVYYGQVILYTPDRYRARVFIILDGMFTLGSLFGPTVSVFLTFNANILGWRINAGNSPGIVLALIWFVLMLNALCLPKEFGTKKTTDEDDYGDDVLHTENSSDPASYGSRSTVCLLFYLVFLGLFFSTTATFYVPLLAQEHFYLQFGHVKLLFLVGRMFSMVVFLSYYVAVDYLHETHLLVCSMLMQVCAIFILTYFAFTWNSASGVDDGYMLMVYISLGMPYFSFSLSCSLLSKITDPKDAAFYQGSSFTALHCGIIVSRLISSFIFTKTSLLWFCLVLVVSWTFGVVWFILEYRNLARPKNNS
jgi:MFS family permease